MNREQIKTMVLEIIKTADYDLWKFLNAETSEDEEEGLEELERLTDVAEKYIAKFDWKKLAAEDGYRKQKDWFDHE